MSPTEFCWAGLSCPQCLAPSENWSCEHMRVPSGRSCLEVIWQCECCDALWEATYFVKLASLLPTNQEISHEHD